MFFGKHFDAFPETWGCFFQTVGALLFFTYLCLLIKRNVIKKTKW